MAYKAINCPNCGAAITSIPDRGSFFCQYCGAKIEKDKTFIEVSGNVTVAGMASVASLLERGFMFLEDSNFKSADEYFDRVLDADPHCSRAYLGKMLATQNSRNTESFCISYFHQVERNEYYQKALKFANDEEYDELMVIKHKNLEYHNKRLKARQDELQKAQATLASFNQYYAKHNYSQNKYSMEIVLFSLVATIVIAIAIIPIVGIFMEGPFFIVICAPFAAMGFGLYYWYKKIKKKKALGEQLEKDKIKLNDDVKSAQFGIDMLMKSWNN